MSDVITAGEILKPGPIGFSPLGPRATPAALQIASHRSEALAIGWIRGRIINPTTRDATKIAATAATLRTTQGSLEVSGVSWLIAVRQYKPQGPRRPAEARAGRSGSCSW